MHHVRYETTGVDDLPPENGKSVWKTYGDVSDPTGLFSGMDISPGDLVFFENWMYSIDVFLVLGVFVQDYTYAELKLTYLREPPLNGSPSGVSVVAQADDTLVISVPDYFNYSYSFGLYNSLLGWNDFQLNYAVGGEAAEDILAGEDVAAGDFVDVYDDAGVRKARRARADLEGYSADGFVLVGGAEGTPLTVYFDGVNSMQAGMTVGQTYFLHASVPGKISANANGNIIQSLGTAVSDTRLLVSIGDQIFTSGGEDAPAGRLFEAAEAISDGDLVNIFLDAGVSKARRARADISGYSASGFAQTGATAGQQVGVFFEGLNASLAGLTVGQRYYLDVVPGKSTITPPSAVGTITQLVGYAVSATELAVEIEEPIENA